MPKPSAIVQRFKLNTHSQQPGETTAMLVIELRHLSEHCEFGITLHEMLRDRLVCGVRDIRIQRWLLAEAKLTLKRALDLALTIEAAYKNASEIHKTDGQGGDLSVNKVDAKVSTGSEVKWFCCGGNHYPQASHFKNAKCYCCGKVRRLAHLCPAKKKGNNLIQLMSRNQATPSLPVFLKVPCKHQGRYSIWGAYYLFHFGSQSPILYKVQLTFAG